MPVREQKRREGTTTAVPEVIQNTVPAKSTAGEKVKAELDDLLDEVDGVLEVNAEEFVRDYIQKGGQ
jgi:prokaryotic ubiquitin-like protein Pup